MSRHFYETIQARRSVYGLTKASPISDEKVRQVIEDAVKHVPSAFNSQSGRVVILFGKSHDELWDHTLEVLKTMVKDPEALKQTEGRIGAFKGAYATVLFFEDQEIVQKLQQDFALYKDNFPIWSLQSSGMLQFAVWTSLVHEGLSANLQHYNPLVDEWVAKKAGTPSTWKLLAQMPFGTAAAPAGEKAFAPLDKRVKVVAA